MTTGNFKYIDPSNLSANGSKPWSKVDGPGKSFNELNISRPVHNIRSTPNYHSAFTTNLSGFQMLHAPSAEKSFTSDPQIREHYYAETETLLRQHLPPGVKKIVIFDHTIRRRDKNSPRQPVQQVHVDQTPGAAETRVRRHLPTAEADELLAHRYQIINVWRPIENPASDYPLAVIDWRSTVPKDFVPVDLMYPQRADSPQTKDDDRGKEVVPDASSYASIENYAVKGETLAVAPNDSHQFFYCKDMTPDEVMLLKCFDSWGEGMAGLGKEGIAVRTPHTAFEDPNTPETAPGRQSIEVRCLVFYEE
ncbi:hypothetical protein MBLNU230_g7756t1 [Neophaeotheca triangularis]